jgi:hypothetical protein
MHFSLLLPFQTDPIAFPIEAFKVEFDPDSKFCALLTLHSVSIYDNFSPDFPVVFSQRRLPKA